MKFYFAILVYASLGSFQAAIAKGDLSSEFTNSAALDEADIVLECGLKCKINFFRSGSTNYWMGWFWDFNRQRANDWSGHRNRRSYR